MNHIVIKIENGAVAEIYCTEPMRVTVVDQDITERNEAIGDRAKTTALSMPPEYSIRSEDIDGLITLLVLECRRPADRPLAVPIPELVEPAA